MERFKSAYEEMNFINRYNYVVTNDKVDEAIKYLNKRYYVITFSENEFVFNKWTGFSTVKGIAYSLREKPYIEFDLIEIQPLSEENWYYYVTDYERWRGNPEKYEH